MSARELDSRHIPRFQETPLPFGESVSLGVTPVVILLLETMMAFFFALWAINRTDIAG